jgi:hypothetical protein
MWIKKENIKLWIWVPTNYIFKQSLAFFTIKDNILDQNNIVHYTGLKDIATIIVYENNTSDELINIFEKYFSELPIIGIFSFTRNRYSKPFTGIIEILEDISKIKFKMEWSILVGNDIGINGKYIDRAFAHNIGINTVTSPKLYFKRTNTKLEWSWPKQVLTINQKKKLFQYEGEPKFCDFLFSKHINIVIITGPPKSGKSILARRISQYLGDCNIYKNELPLEYKSQSLIHISCSPLSGDKIQLLEWINKLNKNELKNLVWIEIDIQKVLVEFLRYLHVEINKKSCPTLSSYLEIKDYYKNNEQLCEDKIPTNITHIKFPIILKKIPQLDYIF